MSLSSLTFIFLFLPILFVVYYFVPKKAKYIILLPASLIFYAWGGLSNLLVLIISILFTFISGLAVYSFKQAGKDGMSRISFFVAIGGSIVMLALFKYTSLIMPIGVSFFTFSEISYICDIYLKDEEANYNLLDLSLYISFFPKITQGPIVQYRDFAAQLGKVRFSRANIQRGVYLFSIGLFKKVILADNLGANFNLLFANSDLSVLSAWLGVILYSFQLYFDFSGYSDMAIGLANMFGFTIEPNFDHPYISKSISEFWRRWHISLGAWFREYIYIPFGGNRRGTGIQVRNLAFVWVLTGIWHGSSLKYVVWGLWHLGFILLEKFVLKDFLKKLPGFINVILTDIVAMVGWIFFFAPTLGSSFAYMGNLFYSSAGFGDRFFVYMLLQSIVLLILSVLCAGGLLHKLYNHFAIRSGSVMSTVTVVVTACLFVFSIASMVGATYSSFLYFQF